MSFVNNSPNMSLPIPQVGVEPGPQFATDINNSLTIIDGHNHSSGYGVAINPDGLNINSDLTFNNNNLIAARSLRLQPQSAVLSLPSDLGCLYEAGVDLYYNDGAGNQVRITQSGAVAGTPGSIANLVSPASASYSSSSETFVWEADSNKPANMDFASAILRNNTANSEGLTLSPPSAMGSSFTITLPNLPGQTNIVTLDTSGNMAATLNVDNSTLTISSNQIKVANLGITNAQIAVGTIAITKNAPRTLQTTTVGIGEYGLTPTSGNYNTSNPFYTDVDNLSITITTSGRPIKISLIGDGAINADGSFLGTNSTSGASTSTADFALVRGGVVIARYTVQVSAIQAGVLSNYVPCSAFQYTDTPAAGTYTYKIQASASVGSGNAFVKYAKLEMYELV